jgi:predicted CoA-binding protein
MSTQSSPLDDAELLLRRTATRIAVVGASNDPAKYGNIIVNNLKAHGYVVLPVNPKEATIAGLPAYRSLAEVPKPVDIVDVVTPPPVTRKVLQEAAAAGVSLVWLQDGSFDDTVLEDVRAAPFRTVHHACIMVVARTVAGTRK